MDDIFKDLIWDALVKLAISQIFKAIPFLAWGPLGWVISIVGIYFANKLYDEVEMFVNFQLIILKNKDLHKKYALAAKELKKLAEGKGIDSKEFKDARERHKVALSELISLAGSR